MHGVWHVSPCSPLPVVTDLDSDGVIGVFHYQFHCDHAFPYETDVLMVTTDGKLQCHIMRTGPRYLGTGLLDNNKVIQVTSIFVH